MASRPLSELFKEVDEYCATPLPVVGQPRAPKRPLPKDVDEPAPPVAEVKRVPSTVRLIRVPVIPQGCQNDNKHFHPNEIVYTLFAQNAGIEPSVIVKTLVEQFGSGIPEDELHKKIKNIRSNHPFTAFNNVIVFDRSLLPYSPSGWTVTPELQLRPAVPQSPLAKFDYGPTDALFCEHVKQLQANNTSKSVKPGMHFHETTQASCGDPNCTLDVFYPNFIPVNKD